MKTILKVLVGSQAHGLATPESDFDYRGVFALPTSQILSLGSKLQTTSWIEGKDDDTSWELSHFLHLATHCNPTILEVFLSPVIEEDEWGEELRSLFPHVWNSQGVMNAFIGYGLNQRKKFLDEKDKRPHKYAAAYLRSLYNAWELLMTQTFTVKIADTEIGPTVRRFKNGEYTFGEVINVCREWEQRIYKVIDYKNYTPKETNLAPINDFLLRYRKANW